jgi:Domain of unknown function (DUF6048)
MPQRLTYKYIFSTLCFLGMLVSSSPAWAKTRYLPTGIQLGMDVFRPFQYQYYGRTGTPYELNAAIDFARYILDGDYGWGHIRWEGHNKKMNNSPSYTSNGKYFRVGLSYNLVQDTPNKNMAFLGLRYARSFLQDHLVSPVVPYDNLGNPIKTGRVFSINREQYNVQARWFEVIAGVRVKIWTLLYVGGALTYKFGLRIDQACSYVPYDVLGWGLNDQEETFGFHLYLSLRIPFTCDTLPSEREDMPIAN